MSLLTIAELPRIEGNKLIAHSFLMGIPRVLPVDTEERASILDATEVH